jgi:hypothetical protein
VLNNLAGNKCTENQSRMKIFQLTEMTQKKETYSKYKGNYNDTFSHRSARAVHQTGMMPFSDKQQWKH